MKPLTILKAVFRTPDDRTSVMCDIDVMEDGLPNRPVATDGLDTDRLWRYYNVAKVGNSSAMGRAPFGCGS